MAILPLQPARVSNAQQARVAQRSMGRTQLDLGVVQNQLSTGKRLSAPSDAPGDASAAMQLRKLLEQRLGYATNLQNAVSHLNEVDSTLGDLSTLLRDAVGVASANVSSTISPQERSAAATAVTAIYNQALSLANKQSGGVYLFGGDNAGQAPFVEDLGGVRFVGSERVLSNQFDDGVDVPFMVDAGAVFGALSSRMKGADLGPTLPPGQTLTPLTPLIALREGQGIDPSGLVIRNGTRSAEVDLSGLQTVEDLLNAINGAGVGVHARINAEGNGIDVLNAVQGLTMSISERGGSTAAQLGIRSFSPESRLEELNDGRGVTLGEGADLKISRRDGTSFDVELSGATTIQDVIDAINAADGGAGVTASFAATGNGLVLTDATAGPGSLAVASGPLSHAAEDLGLSGASAGATVTGRDVHGITDHGLFGNLDRLRDALVHNDPAEITAAAEALQADVDRVVRMRGDAAAQAKGFEDRMERLEEQNLTAKALLSTLEDTDYTEAVMRFQSLQTALQASLQVTGKMLQVSLLDFLG